jgi:hypothetical protein
MLANTQASNSRFCAVMIDAGFSSVAARIAGSAVFG